MAADGFKALAVFDGNNDGQLDAADQVFSRLLLWRDENHDGVSQTSELYQAVQLGVTAISLDERVSGRRDPYGNQFRYRAKISGLRGQPFAYDVFLQRG